MQCTNPHQLSGHTRSIMREIISIILTLINTYTHKTIIILYIYKTTSNNLSIFFFLNFNCFLKKFCIHVNYFWSALHVFHKRWNHHLVCTSISFDLTNKKYNPMKKCVQRIWEWSPVYQSNQIPNRNHNSFFLSSRWITSVSNHNLVFQRNLTVVHILNMWQVHLKERKKSD